ncbi:MAG: serine/threonine-protein kinase [Isosphaeraceae bacterium]
MAQSYEADTQLLERRRPARETDDGRIVGFEPGAVIDGKYRVVREIGSGGMGAVVAVESVVDGHQYALKWCRLGGVWIKRFAREVRLMRRVRHPHVVPVLDANLDATPPYFVMPLAETSLVEALPNLVGRETEALAIFRQVCLGVRAIHESGIVHRDIKPANVLRLANGRYAVSDLGVAKLATRDTTALTQTRAVIGTFGFLAPEQFLPAGSRRADVRTDVYQLGKVLYQILTGRPPALIEPAAVPKGLEHILLRATSPIPEDRYRNLGELLDALRYYELARDPACNAREALESLALQAETLLKRREYRSENIRSILALLNHMGRLDASVALDRFDRLPEGLLPVLAGEFAWDFVPILRAYLGAVRARIAALPFRYADQVARRMRLIALATRHPLLKALALETTLVAAVGLNRFAAMHAFNRMLMAIESAEDAVPVAEMLRANARLYAVVADDIPTDRLHAALHDVRRHTVVTTLMGATPTGDRTDRRDVFPPDSVDE